MAADRPASGKVVTLVESGQWSVSEEFRGVTLCSCLDQRKL